MLDVTGMLSREGAIARRLEGFESRPQQVEMAAAVERTLEHRGCLMVEAGTGIGKSFAYLIPAIKRVVDHNERVVICTNTISLQEQLIEKDIPLLNAVIPEEFTAVLVKGRGNYLSLRRLRLASERQDRLFADEEARHALHVIEDWAYETRDGTLSTLPQLARPEVWDYARSDSGNCMGRKCPTYKQCFYQAARRRMENGDLLVCNHALFFSDLAMRGQGIGFLPPYDHVIIDEAHTAEDVAADHFGLRLAEGRVRHLLRLLYQPRTSRGFLTTLRLEDGETRPIDQTIDLTLTAIHAADALFEDLALWLGDRPRGNGRVQERAIVDNPLSAAMTALGERLKLLRERAATEPDAFELNSYAQRAMEIGREAEILIDQQVDDCVYWLEESSRRARGGRPRLTMACSPVEVGPILNEALFDQAWSTVLCSATLATGREDFSHIAGRLGCEDPETLQLGSPFDHASQVQLIVDRTMPAPNAPEFVDALCPRVLEHIRATDGGAFVLFTSYRALTLVADRLRPELEADGHPILVHGRDGPRGLMLRRFREDDRSVLFGTASFWQGVDVRGRALRNVIITRLPFDVPDRPIVQARHERIEARGGNPFVEDQVPNAVIRFKQGFGRLIRSASDAGRVVVLDSRIATKFYGRRFIDALPDGVQVDEVR